MPRKAPKLSTADLDIIIEGKCGDVPALIEWAKGELVRRQRAGTLGGRPKGKQVKAPYIAHEPDPVPAESPDDWYGWTDERQTIDHERGETIIYRQQIKTGKTKEIRRETYYG